MSNSEDIAKQNFFNRLKQKNNINRSKIEDLDVEMPLLLNKLEMDDLLIITADHGNDPTFKGNDHTRENVPVILYCRNFKEPHRLDVQETFACIGATIADNFDLDTPEIGTSLMEYLN